MTSPLVAAIDCGTNSTRLLISDGTESVERLMRITRLGRDTADTGRLAADAIERTIKVLREYQGRIEHHGVTRVRATATSAARDAVNSDEFMDAAEAVLGVRPEVLSGDEEAHLSFRGATAELDPARGPFLVADIGGGSTEFAFGRHDVEGALSCDIGCVRLTEQFLHHDPPLPEELTQCLSIAELHCHDVERTIPEVGTAATFVGLAGTISNTAAVDLGLAEYDRSRIHHHVMSKDAVEDVFRTLATESYADRVWNPGLERERADVIVGGLCVLVQVMRSFALTEMLVSESDILDGIVASLLD